jgi:plasmid stabilization system protein ParE
MSAFTVRLPEDVTAKLDALAAKLDGSRSYVAAIVSRILHLGERPMIGRPGRIEGTRELPISGTNYIVAHRIEQDGAEILTILDAAQAWPDVF